MFCIYVKKLGLKKFTQSTCEKRGGMPSMFFRVYGSERKITKTKELIFKAG